MLARRKPGGFRFLFFKAAGGYLRAVRLAEARPGLKRRKAAQSVIEYILLVAVAIIALLAVNFLGKFKSGGPFEAHFNNVSGFISNGSVP